MPSRLQVGIGIFTKSSAEYTKRGKRFNEACALLAAGLRVCTVDQACAYLNCRMPVQELDFVLANVLMALVAAFMLVWLPAPTLSYR